jgi:L-alanine-DL-glutamate epimerase-like enolase superfamily enzyme
MSGLPPLTIRAVRAIPLRCPLPPDRRPTSDFGRQDHFDTLLVAVTAEQGLTGYGEAKASVGSMADLQSLAAAVEKTLGTLLIGRDAREIVGLWELMYAGPRAGYAVRTGRPMPMVDRRGTRLAGLSGIDIALWDLYGQYVELPVFRLLGGPVRTRVPVYASGGWAGPEAIGEELARYRAWGGFSAYKIRVGVMDGSLGRAVARVAAARDALGPDDDLYADAHGTMSVAEAKAFLAATLPYRLGFLEEPTPIDDLSALAEVRAQATVPIAAGESEVTRFGFRDLILQGGADILQPDPAIAGGITEVVRIAALAAAHVRVVVPHLWGSAVLFAAGLQLAAALPNVPRLEYPMAGHPAFHDLVDTPFVPENGEVVVPDRPGLGITVREEFVERFRTDGRHGVL